MNRSAHDLNTARTLQIIVLFVGIAALWFGVLDSRHLLRFDEGRYAEIAREMSGSGDWVTIRYDGLKYFEKPPFQMWATALAYRWFGVGEWQARLWVAVSGAAGVGAMVIAARRWFDGRVALLTALVLVSTPAWYLGAHFNSLDMGVSGALACVLAGVLIAQHPATEMRSRRNWMWFAWASVGVAVLTKGLIGIALPGLVLVVYTLVARDGTLWRRLHLVSGALLMMVIVTPWFVLVTLRNPEFPQFFFIHEHWQRYVSTTHHRSGPWWYFVPQLMVGFLPWLGLAASIALSLRAEPRRAGFRPMLLCACWAGAIFVFFSASGSKLPGYILPVYPALALLAAVALARFDKPRWQRYLLVASALLVLGFVGTRMLAGLGGDATPNVQYRAYASWLVAASGLALIGFFLAWRTLARSPGRSIVMYSLTVFGALTIALCGHESFGRAASGIDLVPPIEAVLQPDMPIYSVRLLDHTLPFYLRRTMVLVEAPDELEFGVAQEPQKWVPTLSRFIAIWTTAPHALALMSHETYDELRSRKVPMVPVAEDLRRVVVANFNFASR